MAQNYRVSMKPMHKGPLRQSMALEKSLLEPIYDDEAVAEFALSDPSVRYNDWATCCLALSCQDPCCDEPCKAFLGCSMNAYLMRACNFCSNQKLTLGNLPPATKPIVHAETSTLHGTVRVTREHVVIDRVEGLQNHTVVVPMSAIQEMRVEDAAYDLYALNMFCGFLQFCRLTHPAQRLKLYGQPMKMQTNLCCFTCKPTLIENGVASIPTDNAEELCEVIATQMKEHGVVPDGNAFIALKVEDQFGKLFGRGTVTVVSKSGRAVQFSEKNKIKIPQELELLSKSELIAFLKLNGSPHDFEDRHYDEILDAAIALWGSVRSVPYTEFVAPFPKEKGCCSCNFAQNRNMALCEFVIPKISSSQQKDNPVMTKWNETKMDLGVTAAEQVGTISGFALGGFRKMANGMIEKVSNCVPLCPVKVTFLGKNEPPRFVYKPKIKKDMVAEIKNRSNEV